MEKFNLKELNHDFLHRAQKISSFNVADKDFESLNFKNELQFLYASHIFMDFDWTKTLKGNTINVRELNRLIKKLRQEDRIKFNELLKFTGQSFGPGEVLIYLLHDKVHLAGGKESGDIRVGNQQIELKACEKKVSTQQYFGFYLGGTFDVSDIVSRLLALKKKVGTNGAKAGEVGRIDIANMHKAEPDAMKKIEEDFADISYKHYFSHHPIMFMASKNGAGAEAGDIFDLKQVKPKDVTIDALTSQKIKPFIKA